MPIGRSILQGKPQLAAGLRTTRVTIQQATPSTGTSGHPVSTWTTLTTVRMNRLELRADERFAVAQEAAFTETQFHMEYLASMDPDLVDVPAVRRLIVGTRIYEIRTASVIENKRGIELTTIASSRVNG